ncbi:MAG: hypothetical protein AB2A00_22045 [Myxococcota bacterium]
MASFRRRVAGIVVVSALGCVTSEDTTITIGDARAGQVRADAGATDASTGTIPDGGSILAPDASSSSGQPCQPEDGTLPGGFLAMRQGPITIHDENGDVIHTVTPAVPLDRVRAFLPEHDLILGLTNEPRLHAVRIPTGEQVAILTPEGTQHGTITGLSATRFVATYGSVDCEGGSGIRTYDLVEGVPTLVADVTLPDDCPGLTSVSPLNGDVVLVRASHDADAGALSRYAWYALDVVTGARTLLRDCSPHAWCGAIHRQPGTNLVLLGDGIWDEVSIPTTNAVDTTTGVVVASQPFLTLSRAGPVAVLKDTANELFLWNPWAGQDARAWPRPSSDAREAIVAQGDVVAVATGDFLEVRRVGDQTLLLGVVGEPLEAPAFWEPSNVVVSTDGRAAMRARTRWSDGTGLGGMIRFSRADGCTLDLQGFYGDDESALITAMWHRPEGNDEDGLYYFDDVGARVVRVKVYDGGARDKPFQPRRPGLPWY